MNGFYYDFINKIKTFITKTHSRIVFFRIQIVIIFEINISVERTGFFSVEIKKKFFRSFGHHKMLYIISHLIFNLIEHPNFKDFILEEQ